MGINSSSSNYLDNLIPNSRANQINIDNEIIKRAYIGLSLLDKSTVKKWAVGVNYVHSALFLGYSDSINFEGIVLEFGVYDYDDDERIKYEYDLKGGMRYGKMKYDKFKKELGSAAIINLDLSKSPKIRFNTLIEKLKENNDIWRKEDYSLVHRNCKHFTAKAISILPPKFSTIGVLPGENADLIEGKMIQDIIPSLILEQLKKFKTND